MRCNAFSDRLRGRLNRSGLRGPLALLSVVAVAFTLSSDARARQSSSGTSVVRPKAYVSIQPVPRGRIFEIAVVGRIAHGFHVNAHEPSEDYLIPTRITAELPSGLLLVETTYPRGVMRKFNFAGKLLRVYENAFTVRMKLRATSNAPIGPQKIALSVGYQACTEDTCFPPTKVAATAQLEVAPQDAPALPANRDVFSARPPA